MTILDRQPHHPVHKHVCPLITAFWFKSFCQHPPFELLYPCGCTHLLSSPRWATAFSPDQFLTQMSTDEEEETRARGWNMAAITNRKTSGKGGPCKLTAAASQWKHWWVKAPSWSWASERRSKKIPSHYAAEQRQRGWNNRVLDVRKSDCWRVQRRGRANHHLCVHCLHGRFFFSFFFFTILDLKLNRGNKKRMHAQSSQSSLPGGSRHSLCIMKDAVICEGLRASR